MIKIEKNLAQVPASLVEPPVGRSAPTTHRRREAVFNARQYPASDSKTDARYKMPDIKAALWAIYHGKCAFCEQRVEQWHVEHFRPKSIYYWLAFSWDNLLYACPHCNTGKSNNFDVAGLRALPPANLSGINTLSGTYDAGEQPMFIHPEREDAEPLLEFQADGLVKSNDPRAKYTLDTCQVHRRYLNDYRKKILDDFRANAESERLEAGSKAGVRAAIDVLVRQFRRDAANPENEFLAFRRYALKYLLKPLLNEVLNRQPN